MSTSAKRPGRVALIVLLVLVIVASLVTAVVFLVRGAGDGDAGEQKTEEPRAVDYRGDLCRVGDTMARRVYDGDDVQGGRITFPEPDDYRTPDDSVDLDPLDLVTFVGDADSRVTDFDDDWIGYVIAGGVKDGVYPDLQTAARTIMTCEARSPLHARLVERKDTTDEALTVDGRDAWKVQSELEVRPGADEEEPYDGGLVTVVVVGLEGGDLGVFLGAVPLGEDEAQEQIDETVGQITVG